MTPTLAILTGEYPPAVGGVSDYSAQVARGLAAVVRRNEVHVFAPARAGEGRADASLVVHTLPDRFGVASISMLEDAVDRLPRPVHIIVQYVPHAFGWHAMNWPLCAWLMARGRRDRVTVVFHEVTYPLRRGQPAHHNFLAAVNHGMAAMLARAARRGGMLVTIPAWERLLRKLGARGPIEVSPVPSNLPTAVDASTVERARARFGADGKALIGVFGSFGPLVAPMLHEILPRVIREDRRIVLIGSGSSEFAARHSFGDRAIATGAIGKDEAAAAIAACDVMIQPYPDGVSGRRSSTAAALALGTPVVTNSGELTEDFWEPLGAVALARSPRAQDIVESAERTLADVPRLAALRRAGVELYEERFALRNTIARLLALAGHE
jgi:glycosyltransferase involved in cell wall biosynthesis